MFIHNTALQYTPGRAPHLKPVTKGLAPAFKQVHRQCKGSASMKPDRRLIALLVALAVTVLPQQRAASAATRGPRRVTTSCLCMSPPFRCLQPASLSRLVMWPLRVPSWTSITWCMPWHGPVCTPCPISTTPCATCGGAQSTAFHMQIYIRLFQSSSGGIVVSQPRLLFTGPRGPGGVHGLPSRLVDL
jgi:hypothetical protein